jgi:hypothetical protein
VRAVQGWRYIEGHCMRVCVCVCMCMYVFCLLVFGAGSYIFRKLVQAWSYLCQEVHCDYDDPFMCKSNLFQLFFVHLRQTVFLY